MSSSSRNFHGALDVFLTFDLAEICLSHKCWFLGFYRHIIGDNLSSSQMVVQVSQRGDRDHLQVRDQGCLTGVHLRHNYTLKTIILGSGCHWKHTTCMAHGPIQRQFPNDQGILHTRLRQIIRINQNPHCDRQIVCRTFLAHSCRSQVDDYALAGIRNSGILDSSLDTFTAFLDGSIRQTDNGHTG